MIELKGELYNQCFKFVEKRLQKVYHQIEGIKLSLQSETKSSAGDKHETGRAMLQLEREKAGRQLSEIEKLKEALLKIDTTSSSKKVSLGSIVFTSQNNYFISISAGELKIENKSFYAISPNTPIGKLLLSKQTDDDIQFRDQYFKIENVV